MKKIFAIAFTMVLVLALAAPALAVSTEVTISPGDPASRPFVKCKWEQLPLDVDPCVLEDDDLSHSTPGTQILPPCIKDAKKLIEYYAVVTDEEDGGNVAQVYVDVYHPECSPPPYSTSSDPRGGYFKYEIPFCNIRHGSEAQQLVTDAKNAGLVFWGKDAEGNDYTYDDVMFELDKGTADLWRGEALIDYEQPAGNYKVYCYAIDLKDNISDVLYNEFTYVAKACVEVDFNDFTYGKASLGVEKMVAGDTIWDASKGTAGWAMDNGATIRNIGNTWAHPRIYQNDLGLDQDITGTWNISFDARMGSDDAYRVAYLPKTWQTLPNWLELSLQDELDLSILVKKGTPGGVYTGTITIEAEIEPFCPE